MATKLKPNGDGPANPGHNSAERAKIIREVANEVLRLQQQKAEIQAQITEAKGRLKGIGIKMADFNLALRYYQLEDEDRAESLDAIRECFGALGLGEQLDWLKATGIEPQPAKPTEALRDAPKEPIEVVVARTAGREAGRAGKAATTNPHPAGSDQYNAWHAGWHEAQTQLAEEMGPDGDAPAPGRSERRPVGRKPGNGAAQHASV